jgi:hypothetical protein
MTFLAGVLLGADEVPVGLFGAADDSDVMTTVSVCISVTGAGGLDAADDARGVETGTAATVDEAGTATVAGGDSTAVDAADAGAVADGRADAPVTAAGTEATAAARELTVDPAEP